jgi:hypothetical protein
MSNKMKFVTKHEGYDIYFQAEKEFVPMKKHFMEECDFSKEDYASLVASKSKWFCARVVAMVDGTELGETFLGCCSYKTHKEFYTTHFNGYFKDMMEEAVNEANDRLPSVLKDMKVRAAKLSVSIDKLESCQVVKSL